MAFIKTNHPGLVIDNKTGMVINTNESELRNYRSLVASAKKTADIEKKYNDVVAELQDIKKLLMERKII